MPDAIQQKNRKHVSFICFRYWYHRLAIMTCCQSVDEILFVYIMTSARIFIIYFSFLYETYISICFFYVLVSKFFFFFIVFYPEIHHLLNELFKNIKEEKRSHFFNFQKKNKINKIINISFY